MGRHTRLPADPPEPPRPVKPGEYGAEPDPDAADAPRRDSAYDLTDSERVVGAGAVVLSLGVESLAWWWLNPRTGTHVSYGELIFFFSFPTKAISATLAARWLMAKDPWDGPTSDVGRRLWRLGATVLAPLRWMDRFAARRGQFVAGVVGAAVVVTVVVGIVSVIGP